MNYFKNSRMDEQSLRQALREWASENKRHCDNREMLHNRLTNFGKVVNLEHSDDQCLPTEVREQIAEQVAVEFAEMDSDDERWTPYFEFDWVYTTDAGMERDIQANFKGEVHSAGTWVGGSDDDSEEEDTRPERKYGLNICAAHEVNLLLTEAVAMERSRRQIAEEKGIEMQDTEYDTLKRALFPDVDPESREHEALEDEFEQEAWTRGKELISEMRKEGVDDLLLGLDYDRETAVNAMRAVQALADEFDERMFKQEEAE